MRPRPNPIRGNKKSARRTPNPPSPNRRSMPANPLRMTSRNDDIRPFIVSANQLRMTSHDVDIRSFRVSANQLQMTSHNDDRPFTVSTPNPESARAPGGAARARAPTANPNLADSIRIRNDLLKGDTQTRFVHTLKMFRGARRRGGRARDASLRYAQKGSVYLI